MIPKKDAGKMFDTWVQKFADEAPDIWRPKDIADMKANYLKKTNRLYNDAKNNVLPNEDLFYVFREMVATNPKMKTVLHDVYKNSELRKNLSKGIEESIGSASGFGALTGVFTGDPTMALGFGAARAMKGPLKDMAMRAVDPVVNPFKRYDVASTALRHIDDVTTAFANYKLTERPVSSAIRAATGRNTFTPDDYTQMVDALNELTPEQITQVFADFPVDPDTKERAVDRMAKIVEYARANIPEISPPDPFSKAPRVPSDQQLYKFGRTMRLMMDPAEFKRRLETNTLTAQDINDMRVMYPDLLRQFQLMMMNEYMNTPVKLPYSVRMKLNMVMGNAPTMQNIQQYQQQFAPKEEGTGSNVNIDPSRMAPPTDTLQQRR
jgi:hypothetical protein